MEVEKADKEPPTSKTSISPNFSQEPCPYDCHLPECMGYYDYCGGVNPSPYRNLQSFLRSYDLTILHSSDSIQVKKYLIDKNSELITYLTQKYPEFGPIDMVDINDPDAVYFGIVYAIAEANSFQPLDSSSIAPNVGIPTWLRCTVDVTLGYFDVTGLIAGLGTFEYATFWRAVKSAIKKYAGWIGAAILIYDITTQCLVLTRPSEFKLKQAIGLA